MTDAYKIKVIKFDTGEVVKTLEADRAMRAKAAPTAPLYDPRDVAFPAATEAVGNPVVECSECHITHDLGACATAAPAAAAGLSETPKDWRDQFTNAVYADLAAADNQDVPLEEYPARILKVLDSIVGPRHPTVIHWRNDAIQACIAIAYKYCRDPESFQYLKQDLQALIFAARAPADSVLEDAALLDFIAQHPEMRLRHRKGKWALVGFTNYEYEMLSSLREAIRAARKQGGV